ncbi:hypothetical protein MKX03_007320 [Papaver bracteatum]|nr:hypothetical protein MKX03_007320 [Papaver bracteatum]
MPRMLTKIEGRGNCIKTNVVNMADIAKALARPASYATKTGVSLVNGAHDTAKLAGLLDNFIKKFMIQLKCAACGFVSDADMRDKLTAFIVKNPPAQKKGGKYKSKAMRRAEKERIKEGEAADGNAADKEEGEDDNDGVQTSVGYVKRLKIRQQYVG